MFYPALPLSLLSKSSLFAALSKLDAADAASSSGYASLSRQPVSRFSYAKG
jgi:hypothetical protein